MSKITGTKKQSPAKTKGPNLLSTVPYERVFHFFTELGKYTGITANSTFEFAEKLQKIPIQSFTLHFQRQDFKNDSDTLATKHAVFADVEDMVERDVPSLGRRDGKWHFLNGADALHLAFANSVNAEAIATFDDDFRGVHGSVLPLMISEVYMS